MGRVSFLASFGNALELIKKIPNYLKMKQSVQKQLQQTYFLLNEGKENEKIS